VTDGEVYGVVAEFDDPDKLVHAAKSARENGYRRMEAYSPYPIEELSEIIPRVNLLPAIVFVAGALGAATAWIMQYYIAAIDYPINVGGRPLYSWPSFIPILFELTVLFAACAAFFGMLVLCGFPHPHFPLFNSPRFAGVSSGRFYLCIESCDPLFRPDRTAELLESLDPIEVWEVENS
jgi:hypothetical protein